VDLSSNEFTGRIPAAWSRLQALNIELAGNMISELPEELCDNNGWLNGLVGLLSTCDAILCQPGTHADKGRETATQQCQFCFGGTAGAPYYGTQTCIDPNLRAERELLVEFYKGSNGTSWLIQSNWLTDSPTCTWYGVTCDEGGYIEELSLANNFLKGTGAPLGKPSLILTLPHLKVRYGCIFD
jgi:hypothetical protein